MLDNKDRRELKKELQKEFPEYKIFVRKGKGTASHWTNIRIKTDIEEKREEGAGLKPEISDKLNEIRLKAEKVANEFNPSQYNVDDGFGTKRDCVDVDVKLAEEKIYC